MTTLVEALRMALDTNGGPIEASDTVDGHEYALVRMDAFDAMRAALAEYDKGAAPAAPVVVNKQPVREPQAGLSLTSDPQRAAPAAPQPLVGYVCEHAALKRLRDDVDALPLHSHKRAAVREWIDTHIEAVARDARKAGAAPAAPSQAHLKRTTHEH